MSMNFEGFSHLPYDSFLLHFCCVHVEKAFMLMQSVLWTGYDCGHMVHYFIDGMMFFLKCVIYVGAQMFSF